ncbi:hypothetical protein GC174_07110 [bacterium]|nr:hypothetical protein [bacterium]
MPLSQKTVRNGLFTLSCTAILSISSILPVLAESEVLKSAVKFFEEGSYASVIDKLSAAEKLGEEQYKARYYRGLAYQKLNRKEQAIKDFKWLYYNSKDKTVRYKAWQALRGISSASSTVTLKASTSKQEALADGPGADAWVSPSEGYGRSGPPAYSRLKVQRYAKPCGH